jgi:DNA-binding transcriptional LysR family regulator
MVGAARELSVEHTPIGRRLASLESALGVRLFARGPGGLTLTTAGDDILPLEVEIAERVAAIACRVTGADSRVEGTVRLTMGDNRAFDLRRGEADLAVRFVDVSDPELITRKLGKAGWSLYAAPSYVARKGGLRAAEDLRGHDVIGFAPSLAAIVGETWLKAHAEGASIVVRANSVTAACDAGSFGYGLVPLPCFVGDPAPGLQRLTPRVIGFRDVTLVVHPDLARVARVRAAMDFIAEAWLADADMWSGDLPKLAG